MRLSINRPNKTNKKSAAAAGLTGFPIIAYWKELKGTIVAKEPTNPTFIKKAQAQTVPEEGVDAALNTKFIFNENFNVPVFIGRTKVFQYTRSNRKKLDRRTMEPIMKSMPQQYL